MTIAPSLHTRLGSLMKETIFVCPNYFIHGRWGCIHLPQGEPEIKYLLQEGMPRKLIGQTLGAPLDSSLAWRTLSSMLHYRLSWSLSGVSLSRAPGQESGQELVQTPAALNYEFYGNSELCYCLKSSSVCWHGPLLHKYPHFLRFIQV